MRFLFRRVLYNATRMRDDGTLLGEYAQSGSEAAFAQLVQRHLDFVLPQRGGSRAEMSF